MKPLERSAQQQFNTTALNANCMNYTWGSCGFAEAGQEHATVSITNASMVEQVALNDHSKLCITFECIENQLTYLGGFSERLGQLQCHGDVPQSSRELWIDTVLYNKQQGLLLTSSLRWQNRGNL